MADNLKAKVVLEGDASGATKAIKQTEKGFGRLTAGAKRMGVGTVAAFVGAAVAIRGLVNQIGKAVKAAQVQEDAINALDGALASMGDNAGKVSKALQEQAAALQQATKYGDEEIIQAQALIASFVKEESQIKAATQATLDLAEAKGMSLKGAADLIAKTLGSSTNAMSRYGIEVEGAVGSTERLASLTGNIEKVFGGRAAKAADTFSGRLQQLKNAIGDTYEEVGFALTKNEELIDGLGDMKKNVEELTPAFGDLATTVVGAGVGFGNLLVQFGELIYEWNQFLGTIDDVDDAMEDTAINTKALEATAARLGITVEELKERLASAGQGAHILSDGAGAAANSLDDVTTATERAAKAQKKLDEASKESATAMEELGKALGIVTSAELEAEILKINTALEKVRVTSGEWSPEFIRQQEVAEEKVENLRARIESLKSGFGDLAEEEATVEAATDSLGESMSELVTHTQDMGVALNNNLTFLRNTAIAYDQLAKSIGETAAQQQALESGMATLSQGGTRIRFAGGGSRLVNTSGRNSSSTVTSYGLSPFGTGGKVKVDADGSVRPD